MSDPVRRSGAAPQNVWVVGSDSFHNVEATAVVSTTPAYTSGDVVGGVMTFANVVSEAGQSILVRSLRVYDVANQRAAGTFLLFHTNPVDLSATVTDNTAFAWGSASPALIGAIPVTAGNFTQLNSQAVAHLAGQDRVMKCRFTSIYGVFVTTGTPTYAAVDNLRFEIGLERP